MSDAPIVITEYEDSWPDKYEEERQYLITVAGQWNHGGIEHIGSTAVPGMPAKPIIDIMFGVESLETSKPAIEALTSEGYKYSPYKANEMHWFCKPSPEFRTHHLHLVPFESPLWRERIQFRDLLRSNSDLAREYAQLKRELAKRFRHDREAYTESKWPFIQQAFQSAS
ncbi:MAG: GrpB family protein [Pseudomonadota bacterium]